MTHWGGGVRARAHLRVMLKPATKMQSTWNFTWKLQPVMSDFHGQPSGWWNSSFRWRTDSALCDQHWTKISSVLYKKTWWTWLDANQPWLWRWWMCRWKCNKSCNSICACFWDLEETINIRTPAIIGRSYTETKPRRYWVMPLKGRWSPPYPATEKWSSIVKPRLR